MNGNTITDLREILFTTMREVSNKNNPMDIDRARAISDLAQVAVNSVKVEVDFLRVAGGQGSGFVPSTSALPAPEAKAAASVLPNGAAVIERRPGVTVTRHRLEG